MPVAQVEPRIWPGENGFLCLEYRGGASGVKPWRGRVTKAVYWFGSDRPIGYVDARDAVKFLAPIRTSEAMPVFRVYDESHGNENQ